MARDWGQDCVMHDFTQSTAAETLAALDGLTRRERHKAALRLLYKKRFRPANREAQRALLEAFADWQDLSRFERTYALVAAGHKACELADKAAMAALLPRLEEAYAWALTLPCRNVLRMDGLHMRFSILNVLINGSLLSAPDDAPRHADTALAAFEAIDMRRASPYLFNSTSNIVKTLCLATLLRPETLARRAREAESLLDFAMSLRGWRHALLPLTRRWGPRRLEDRKPHRAFREFEDTMQRFLLLRRAAATDASTKEALRQLAESSIAQYTPEQKHALLSALLPRIVPRRPD